MSKPFVMTPEHPKWKKFYARLSGPKACDFRDRRDGGWSWKCKGGARRPLARQILKDMGADVAASIDFFDQRGGHCDCEIIFNVDPKGGK